MLKINISYVYSHKYMKTEIDSDDDLPLEKTWNRHNVVLVIRSMFFLKIIIIIAGKFQNLSL